MIESRASEMKSAREAWDRASEELQHAHTIFEDLNLSGAAAAMNWTVRNAVLRESWTRKKYAAALQRYVEAVRTKT